ncbi:hypothetical protein CsSME_00053250 [Camellia sinensis var. sinensis]
MGTSGWSPNKVQHILFCFSITIIFSLLASLTRYPSSAAGPSGLDPSSPSPPAPPKRSPTSLASSSRPEPPPETLLLISSAFFSLCSFFLSPNHSLCGSNPINRVKFEGSR